MKPISVMLEGLNSRYPLVTATGILDDGCGPGPIMTRILSEFGSHIPSDCKLICSDFAPAMVEQVQEAKMRLVLEDPESIWDRVETDVLDCMSLASVGDGQMSHVAAGWVRILPLFYVSALLWMLSKAHLLSWLFASLFSMLPILRKRFLSLSVSFNKAGC